MISTMRAAHSVRSLLPEDHPLYADIGHVTAQWAHLEHILDLIIWDLASITPAKGACITGQIMGALPRFHAILNLGRTHGLKKQTLDTIQKLMQETMDVSEERNRIIHDAWYLEAPSGKTFQFRSMPRKDPTYGFKEIDKSKLTDILRTIKRRIDSVYAVRDKILRELQPSS